MAEQKREKSEDSLLNDLYGWHFDKIKLQILLYSDMVYETEKYKDFERTEFPAGENIKAKWLETTQNIRKKHFALLDDLKNKKIHLEDAKQLLLEVTTDIRVYRGYILQKQKLHSKKYKPHGDFDQDIDKMMAELMKKDDAKAYVESLAIKKERGDES